VRKPQGKGKNMIIVMHAGAPADELRQIEERVKSAGLTPHVIRGTERNVVAVIGDERGVEPGFFEVCAGVEKVMRVLAPYKLTSRESSVAPQTVKVGGVEIGGKAVVLAAGPCTVENRAQILNTARAVKAAGATLLRGGAFKPRTNPYAFQGLQKEGLEYLAEARADTGLPIVTEVMTPADVELVAAYADMLQVGTRNMQNFLLLKELGKQQKPVLLKRGMAATLEEWLLAAEYILSQGNRNVVLCERGIRTFETHNRNTLALAVVAAAKIETPLPVLVDPSHGTGRGDLVPAMSRAAIAAGADGLLLEVCPNPARAALDGNQSLSTEQFANLVHSIRAVAEAVGRTL
jgi:3-deoxy-7-phosphoheptulonate synthase